MVKLMAGLISMDVNLAVSMAVVHLLDDEIANRYIAMIEYMSCYVSSSCCLYIVVVAFLVAS